MTSKDIALQYFDLANKGALDEIEDLLTDESVYVSENTGSFEGKDAIRGMMRGYFGELESLHWEVEKVEEMDTDTILIEFIHTGRRKSGEEVLVHGQEYITVANGKISKIEIKNI